VLAVLPCSNHARMWPSCSYGCGADGLAVFAYGPGPGAPDVVMDDDVGPLLAEVLGLTCKVF
jgi:hypothetical protein